MMLWTVRGDHHGDAHVQRATMRMPGNHGRVSEVMCIVILDMTVSFVLAVIGIRQEAVERRECREAQRHGNHSEKPADVLDTLEYLGHEVECKQHDDGAEGDGHRKLLTRCSFLAKPAMAAPISTKMPSTNVMRSPTPVPHVPHFTPPTWRLLQRAILPQRNRTLVPCWYQMPKRTIL